MFNKWGGFIIMEHQPYNKIGITESGDPCFDFSWVKNLQDVNIIITKGLNDRMIRELIKNKDKIILHLTCTGNGRTDIEPNVLSPEKLKERLLILLKKGFNSNQIVLRIDPIILNKKYYNNSFIPIILFKDIIKRLRFSFLNMFSSCGIKYKIKQDINIKYFLKTFINKAKRYYTLESCSGISHNKVVKNACVSQTDLDILNKQMILSLNNRKRFNCNIPGNIIELLTKNNCKHNCKYCYLNKTKEDN
jgi:DNA repair photolyase